jgi:hypothetical protein
VHQLVAETDAASQCQSGRLTTLVEHQECLGAGLDRLAGERLSTDLPAEPVGTLEHDHVSVGAAQLTQTVGGGEPGDAASHDDNPS